MQNADELCMALPHTQAHNYRAPAGDLLASLLLAHGGGGGGGGNVDSAHTKGLAYAVLHLT